MSVEKGEIFSKRDVFVDYDFEDVMFRWDHKAKLTYCKFYGKIENPEPVPHNNRLFNDALLYGDEITESVYLKGKPQLDKILPNEVINICPICNGKGQTICPVCNGKGRPCDCNHCGDLETNEECGYILCVECKGTGNIVLK